MLLLVTYKSWFIFQLTNIYFLGAELLKEKAAEALVAGSEYAEILKEKAAEAAEMGNEYLAEGAEKAKELAMYVLWYMNWKKMIFFMFSEYAEEAVKQSKVFKEVAKEKIGEVAEETLKSMLYYREKQIEL